MKVQADRRAPEPQGQVLRDVVIDAQVHTLARPARAQEPAVAADAPQAPAALPAEAPPERQAECEQAFARGYEQGRSDGERAGRDAAAAQAMTEAHEQGRREGMEAGMQAAREAANAEVKASLAALEALLRTLPEQFGKRLATVEEDMVALCFEAVTRVLGDSAATADGVRAMLRLALEQFGARRLAEIRVHPDDLHDLASDATVDAWLRRREDGQEIRIVADAAIELGGVVLRSPAGRLDARLETQVAALRSALAAVRARRAARRPAPARAPARAAGKPASAGAEGAHE